MASQASTKPDFGSYSSAVIGFAAEAEWRLSVVEELEPWP